MVHKQGIWTRNVIIILLHAAVRRTYEYVFVSARDAFLLLLLCLAILLLLQLQCCCLLLMFVIVCMCRMTPFVAVVYCTCLERCLYLNPWQCCRTASIYLQFYTLNTYQASSNITGMRGAKAGGSPPRRSPSGFTLRSTVVVVASYSCTLGHLVSHTTV